MNIDDFEQFCMDVWVCDQIAQFYPVTYGDELYERVDAVIQQYIEERPNIEWNLLQKAYHSQKPLVKYAQYKYHLDQLRIDLITRKMELIDGVEVHGPLISKKV